MAHEVLVRVASEGAFADRALEATIERAALNVRDAALATELVYGTLRHVRRLDFLLGSIASRPLRKLSAGTLVALRLGAYQLLELRVADHGAVNEAVSLVRAHKPHQAGFVNAVLREIVRRRDAGSLLGPRRGIADPVEALAVETSHPTWLLAGVAAELGLTEAEAFARADNETPALGLRVNRLRAAPEAVARALTDANVEVVSLPGVPGALYVRRAGAPASLAAFARGEITIQDPAAQLVGHFCAPRPGALTLDACAAPGGKATHLAELMGDRGRVVAVDHHAGKLRLVRESALRLGLRAIETAAADATDAEALRGAVGGASPSLILLDAPCSGTGTLRRNPEVRGRDAPRMRELVILQDQLLGSCASLLEPRAILVYAVCSVTRAEGPDRIEAFLRRHAELTLAPPPHAWLSPYLEPLGGGSVLRTWPHRHGMDGFFAARLVRR